MGVFWNICGTERLGPGLRVIRPSGVSRLLVYQPPRGSVEDSGRMRTAALFLAVRRLGVSDCCVSCPSVPWRVPSMRPCSGAHRTGNPRVPCCVADSVAGVPSSGGSRHRLSVPWSLVDVDGRFPLTSVPADEGSRSLGSPAPGERLLGSGGRPWATCCSRSLPRGILVPSSSALAGLNCRSVVIPFFSSVDLRFQPPSETLLMVEVGFTILLSTSSASACG